MAFPELMPTLEPHKVREVYVMQWQDPQVVVDISDTLDLKLRALACHASQFKDFAAVEARVRDRAPQLGQAKGYAYAEAVARIVIPGRRALSAPRTAWRRPAVVTPSSPVPPSPGRRARRAGCP